MKRGSPGPCPICDAPHCSCRADDGPIAVVQLPQRDAAAGAVPQADGDRRPLGDGSDGRSFSTATYRGTKKKR